MREGPLAALFLRTDETAQEAEEAAKAAEESVAASEKPQDPRALRVPSVPQPTTPAAEQAARERGYPHPSLGADRPPEEPEPPVPTPQERLRYAFSSEQPDAELAGSGASAAGSRRQPFGAPGAALDAPWGHARTTAGPVIRVVGVGGAGVNAVNRMVEAEVAGVDFVAVNTDMQSLAQSSADVTIHIGPHVTRGLGAGADPDLGRQAAMEEYDRMKAHLKGSDMVFIAAGAGGGTGTGAAPVVARISREIGALTVAIVTKPFAFEGNRRAETATSGIDALRDEVDTLIVVPNNRLLSVLTKQTSMVEAFRVADDVLRQGVQGVSDLVTLPGLINLDFADVRTIMSGAGTALLGIGMGVGEHRATDAAASAVASPLLDTSMEGASKILLSITGGESLSLWEVNEAAKAVSAAAHPDANIIFGAMVDEKLDDQVWVTVVATGYEADRHGARRPLQEPAGEPRVWASRREAAGAGRTPPSSRGRAHDWDRSYGPSPARPARELDVPEFMPRR